jgi:hypothetical protein
MRPISPKAALVRLFNWYETNDLSRIIVAALATYAVEALAKPFVGPYLNSVVPFSIA